MMTALLLLVGLPIAGRFRPLNATEWRLIGTWAFVSDGTQKMHFREDRRVVCINGREPEKEIASWTAADEGRQLRIFADDARVARFGWSARLMALMERFRPRKPSTLRFHDSDRALIYGIECRRELE